MCTQSKGNVFAFSKHGKPFLLKGNFISILSKIFKRVIYDQLDEYLVNNGLLYEYQSGVRKGLSTDTCFNHLTNYNKFQMDKGHYVGMILLDSHNAFDTVNHIILLMKLRAIS